MTHQIVTTIGKSFPNIERDIRADERRKVLDEVRGWAERQRIVNTSGGFGHQIHQQQESWRRDLNRIYTKHEHYFQDVNNEGFVQYDYDKIFADFENLISTERQRVLNEVEGWLDEMPIYMETDDYSSGKPSMAPLRAELRAKLEEMGGEKC